MKKIPFTNNTKKVKHIGSVTIWPGSTRHVFEYDHPDFKSEPVADEPEPSFIDVLDKSIGVIAQKLPSMSDDEIAQLREAEKNGKTRSTLISAFDAELLRRDEHQRLSGELSPILGGDDEIALMSAREHVSNHADLVELVDARLSDIKNSSDNKTNTTADD